MLVLLGLLAAAVAAWRAWRRARFFLHTFQLVGYKGPEFGAWLRPRLASRVLAPSHAAGLAVVGALALAGPGVPVGAGAAAHAGWAVAFASDGRYTSEREKKPIAFTARMRRLATATLVLGALPAAAGTALAITAEGAAGVLPLLAGWLVADAGAPLWVALAGALLRPVETAIQDGFKRRAQAAIAARPDLTVVAITGSYGKTSTKFAVAEVLRQRFNTLASPSSFNTPMGVCLVVNDQLRADHRALVLEMGARYDHDIRELTALVRPDIAVVTSVGVAHLETMGPIENIARVKGDLVAAVKPGGQVVLNADDARVAAMTERLPPGAGRVWRVSVAGPDGAAAPDADLVASDVRYDARGMRFTLAEPAAGETADVTTPLLGAHNVTNALLAAAVGRAMGLRLRQIAHALARLEPVEHRLQLREGAGGVTVIDDAFNSNPVGAANAVEILGLMAVPEGGRRAIVTPGMVELGARQEVENRAFGEAIARHLTGPGDLAVLVGRRQTAPIQEGLRAAGFPEDRLHVVGSFFEAQDLLRGLLREGDVVLYENDLPDTYDEPA